MEVSASLCLNGVYLGCGQEFHERRRQAAPFHTTMKVLLSYAQADTAWVDELASLLTAAGLDLERVDTARSDPAWEELFRQQLESADLVVSVMTESERHNSLVLFDYGAAKSARKLAIPLLVSGSQQPPEIPRFVEETYYWVETPEDAAEQIKQFVAARMATV